MSDSKRTHLSKREQQVMELLYEQGPLAASEVLALLPNPPTNSAVRSTLRLLVEKGHALRKQDGFRYLYAPAVARGKARRSALQGLLKTFFDGSPRKAFVELLDLSKEKMEQEDWDHLAKLVNQARKEED